MKRCISLLIGGLLAVSLAPCSGVESPARSRQPSLAASRQADRQPASGGRSGRERMPDRLF